MLSNELRSHFEIRLRLRRSQNRSRSREKKLFRVGVRVTEKTFSEPVSESYARKIYKNKYHKMRYMYQFKEIFYIRFTETNFEIKFLLFKCSKIAIKIFLKVFLEIFGVFRSRSRSRKKFLDRSRSRSRVSESIYSIVQFPNVKDVQGKSYKNNTELHFIINVVKNIKNISYLY